MSLHPGTRLGPYEIAAKLGEGGMGEVYRATDTSLKRQVAIKVLPQALAADADRLARFQREAEVLAALNHPNIAAIYGLEEGQTDAGQDVRALVMELVEGETLAQRLATSGSSGPRASGFGLPVDEGLAIAKQIAEALEAAHAQGIVHRDLKPANVKVRPDGTVKVLDFGLAKALDPGSGTRDRGLGDLTQSPTITTPAMTQAGMILGTAAYMSPEQARGDEVDARTDIWSFGVVLFEMLTGTRLFDGPTVSDTLAAVLRAEPDWNRLPVDLPPAIVRLLRRCLQRDPKRRLQHIGDARLEIEEPLDAHETVRQEPALQSPWRLALLAAALAAIVVGPLAWVLKPESPAAAAAPTSFLIRTVADAPLARSSPLALSPDGRQLLYTVGLRYGFDNRLFHQSLDRFDARWLEEAVDASMPFFSRDGQVVGFHSWPDRLRQLRLSGGAPTELLPGVRDNVGADWTEDGRVVFVQNWGRPLSVAGLDGSGARELTRLDVANGERAHLWPRVLPGGRVLFTIWTAAPSWDEELIAVADLATGAHSIVLRGGTSGQYAASGHLIFWRGNALMAAPFDLDALAVTGDAVQVVTGVRLDNGSGSAHMALSETGTLAYVEGGTDTFAESFIVDRMGRQVTRLDEAESVGDPTFSPDGTRVAVTLFRNGAYGVGVFDLERGLLTPLPLVEDNLRPVWSPDGDRVTFSSNAGGAYNFYSMPFDGSGTPEVLFPVEESLPLAAPAWTSGGQFAFVRASGETGSDIWLHTPGEQTTPQPLIATRASENRPAFSSDGRFIAYQSDESGRVEIYVRPFPDVGTRRELVSRGGGTDPVWSRDGRELLYLTERGIMRVAVNYPSGSAWPSFSAPSLALEMSGLNTFDISPDGRTFAVERVPVEKAAREIRVVVNWFEELKRLLPR